MRYVHPTPEHKREAVRKLERYNMERSILCCMLWLLRIAVTVYAVLDLEYPRFGLIRLDAADRALLQLRDSIR